MDKPTTSLRKGAGGEGLSLGSRRLSQTSVDPFCYTRQPLQARLLHVFSLGAPSCSLSRPGTAIINPKFAVNCIYIYIYISVCIYAVGRVRSDEN